MIYIIIQTADRGQFSSSTHVKVVGDDLVAVEALFKLGGCVVGELVPVNLPQALLLQTLPGTLPLYQGNPGGQAEIYTQKEIYTDRYTHRKRYTHR